MILRILTLFAITCVAVYAQNQTEIGPRKYLGVQDQSVGQWKPPATTVASLPAASGAAGQVYLVTDSATVGSCTSGAGSARTLCVSNGTAWVALGDGTSGGAGGDITAVGDCSTGDCFQAAAANTVLAAPSGTSGQASMRSLVAADIPSLDASKITTGVVPGARGGTNNGFFEVSGPATTTKTFTFPNSNATVLTDAAAVTVAQGGTGITSGTSGGVPYFSGATTMASSAALAANTIVMGGGAGAAPTTAAGYTVQAAGSAGATLANAGTSTALARSDHEHWLPWQAGVGVETTPTASTYVPVPVPISAACGGSGAISATSVSVTAVTKGTGNMTFNVYKCTNAGTCVTLFATDQTYSNTGNNRQDFTPGQNNTSLNSTDYFRFFIGSTVNGQDDFSITVSGKCKSI